MTDAPAKPESTNAEMLSAQLRTSTVFDRLEPAKLGEIAAAATRVRFSQGAMIVRSGDPLTGLYVVLAGCVRTFLDSSEDRDPPGAPREISLSLDGPGSLVGEIPVVDGGVYSASVRAVEDTELLLVPTRLVREHLRSSAAFALSMAALLARRYRELVAALGLIAFNNVSERIIRLFRQRAIKRDGVLVVPERLTHEAIAREIGCSRGMVSRIIRDLAGRGDLDYRDQHIVISEDGGRLE